MIIWIKRSQNLIFMKEASVILLFFYLSLVPIVNIGCGDVKTSSYFTPPKSKLDKYEALEIFDFETIIPDFPKEALAKIPNDVEKILSTQKNSFKEVSRGDIENIPPDKTIILLGEVTNYIPGTDVTFEGGAVKFGEVTLSLKLALVQKDSGIEITSGEVSGFSSLGILRSGRLGKDMYEIIADEIVKFISESY
jgi:hypothetical protein